MQYYPCSDTGSWSISSPSPAGTDTGTLCSLDYIIINGGMGTCPSSGGSVASNMSYCGTIFSALNAAITTGLICGKKYHSSIEINYNKSSWLKDIHSKTMITLP